MEKLISILTSVTEFLCNDRQVIKLIFPQMVTIFWVPNLRFCGMMFKKAELPYKTDVNGTYA